jgi:hypothetical protein
MLGLSSAALMHRKPDAEPRRNRERESLLFQRKPVSFLLFQRIRSQKFSRRRHSLAYAHCARNFSACRLIEF